ncbi:MAG TPA: hypothetical protein VKT51_05180 [Candidatus Eremiobacteraceae bacterium]|nr:hypothetical protein [Candidatus Eremiobacteraceae bacterium]
MTSLWRVAAVALCFAVASVITSVGGHGALSDMALARPHRSPQPSPSPSPSPTAPPTPSFALDQIPTGTWLMILQPAGYPIYSNMTLKDDGTTVTGTWAYDPKTTYALSGTRDGSHIKLALRLPTRSATDQVGTMDITIDTYADMFGSVSIGPITDMPFTAAQHSRVPPPVDSTPAPDDSPYPPQ